MSDPVIEKLAQILMAKSGTLPAVNALDDAPQMQQNAFPLDSSPNMQALDKRLLNSMILQRGEWGTLTDPASRREALDPNLILQWLERAGRK